MAAQPNGEKANKAGRENSESSTSETLGLFWAFPLSFLIRQRRRFLHISRLHEKSLPLFQTAGRLRRTAGEKHLAPFQMIEKIILPVGIQLAENIIQQNHGLFPCKSPQQLRLR